MTKVMGFRSKTIIWIPRRNRRIKSYKPWMPTSGSTSSKKRARDRSKTKRNQIRRPSRQRSKTTSYLILNRINKLKIIQLRRAGNVTERIVSQIIRRTYLRRSWWSFRISWSRSTNGSRRCAVSWSQIMGVTGLMSLKINWSYLILIITRWRGMWMALLQQDRSLLRVEGECLVQTEKVPAEDHLHHLLPEILHFSKLLLTTTIKQVSYINKVLLHHTLIKPLIIKLFLFILFRHILITSIFLFTYLLVICFLELINIWDILIHSFWINLRFILYWHLR